MLHISILEIIKSSDSCNYKALNNFNLKFYVLELLTAAIGGRCRWIEILLLKAMILKR